MDLKGAGPFSDIVILIYQCLRPTPLRVTYLAFQLAFNSWLVGVNFGNSVNVTSSWGVSLSGSGSSYTASNVGYNGNLGAGTSTTFGMQGNCNPGSVSCNQAID